MVACFSEPQACVDVRNTFLDLDEAKEADIYRRRRSEPVVRFQEEGSPDTSDAASMYSTDIPGDSTFWATPAVAQAPQASAMEAEPMKKATSDPWRSQGAKQDVTCLRDHKLLRESLPYNGKCDTCLTKLPFGEEVMRCSSCNWDLCIGDHEQAHLVVRNTFLAIDEPKDMWQRRRSEPHTLSCLRAKLDLEEDCDLEGDLASCSTDATEDQDRGQQRHESDEVQFVVWGISSEVHVPQGELL